MEDEPIVEPTVEPIVEPELTNYEELYTITIKNSMN